MLKRMVPWLSLFSSLGTLICCALPALLVSLGLGATLVSILGAFPQLVWFSERKELVFSVAGLLLLFAGLLRFKRGECPADPILASHCNRVKTSGGWIFYVSIVLYLVGGFFAFVAPLLF